MQLKPYDCDLSICKVKAIPNEIYGGELCFIGKTDEELSVVCETKLVPGDAEQCDSGWRAFRIQGVLDFSLTGILAPIAAILAENKIGIFAVSTYNTDYLLIKQESFQKALGILANNGYEVID